MKYFSPIAFVLLVLSLPAIAQDTSPRPEKVFICTPDAFTLKVQKRTALLTGSIKTPSPGYTYKMIPSRQDTFGVLASTLIINKPEETVLQNDDKIDLDYEFTFQRELLLLYISIQKPFPGELVSISCQEKTGP